MKRHISKGFYFLSILLLLASPSIGLAAAMADYCQTPPFIGTGGEPNVLVLEDVSGSMSYDAYSSSYSATTGYEGYFDPAKNYVLESDGVTYRETSGTACTATCSAHSCVRRQSSCANGSDYGGGSGAWGCSGSNTSYGCCTAITTSGDCSPESGNQLNHDNMERIDIIRWSLTGGRPSTCEGTFASNKCDPELWSSNTGAGLVGTVCNNSLDVNGDGVAEGGCILKADNGTKVKVRWSRIYAGLAYQFMQSPVQPRLGAMSYDSSSINANKVYVGDYLSTLGSISTTYPYMNFITLINSQNPGGGTPTGPAMWDALNYYSQQTPRHGGLTPQTGSSDSWKNPLYNCDSGSCILNSCARNFVILMSDGEWNDPSSVIGSSPTCTITATSDESADPMVPAYCAHKGIANTMGTTSTTDDIKTKVNGVYTVGLFMPTTSAGYKALQNIAMYGSFDNDVKTWPDSRTGFPTNTSGSLGAALPASSSDWDADGNSVPDTFFSADDALAIKQEIMNAFQDILSRATSGTAASVLASGEGSGANLVQATYYPKRRFFSGSVSWIGGLQNLWYYIDPQFANSNIREDDGDNVLTLKTDAVYKDYIAQFYFDVNEQKARARIFPDANGDGAAEAQTDTIDFEELKTLWDAGKLLWNRAASDRSIYVPLDTTQALTADANKFSAATPDNISALRPLLNTDITSASTTVNNQLAANIIDYVRGVDIPNYAYTVASTNFTEIYRPRTIKIDLNDNGNVTDTGVMVYGVSMNETVPKVWKLGDIISSTPKISSWVALNKFDVVYADASYKAFLDSSAYTNRGAVYVGSNDGMLHAFNLGKLELKWTGQNAVTQKSRLTGTDLGKEKWAFIPKNVLPYLKYLKETDYCHVSSVDLSPYVFDASINMPAACSTGSYWNCSRTTAENWRTILIGGMKLGGACRDTASTCTDCVKTPVTGNGYSSYFALDVTDQNNPKFLWEFTSPDLGFSTSSPAIVRISSRTAGPTSSVPDINTNGRWFVVIGSGPTGPIDTVAQKFLARSDQNLKLLVLDLKTGSLVRTIDTGIQYAFAGSMLHAAHDSDRYLDYQDDSVYIPYVKRTGTSPNYTWTDGGVLRLLTNEDLDGNNVSATGDTGLNPDNWRFSKVIDGIGPVTSAVSRLESKKTKEMWLYFGTGRYFYKNSTGTDDASGLRQLFGIKDPCFENMKYKTECLDASTSNDLTRTFAELSVVNLTSPVGSSATAGWYITLDASGTATYDGVARQYDAERVITDPLTTTSGNVFFTTTKPFSDTCSIGGKSYIWAVNWDTGDPLSLQGTALIQVSTGSIEQVNLSNAFTEKSGRRTSAIEGIPPTGQGFSLMASPSAVKRVLHSRER
jgi:type IV pilus assembly protein PilY1